MLVMGPNQVSKDMKSAQWSSGRSNGTVASGSHSLIEVGSRISCRLNLDVNISFRRGEGHGVSFRKAKRSSPRKSDF